MRVALKHITPDAEKFCIYLARVSSPKQDNPDYTGLLHYCVRNGHWSVLEQAHATFEIETSRAIAAQLLRHKSFSFQEFSQRYAKALEDIELCEPRRQDAKNRQNSIDDLPADVVQWFMEEQNRLFLDAYDVYLRAMEKGVARECARFLLPLSTRTRLYVTGNLRSWFHYLIVRCAGSTQLEHREIALEILNQLRPEVPIVAQLVDEELNRGRPSDNHIQPAKSPVGEGS